MADLGKAKMNGRCTIVKDSNVDTMEATWSVDDALTIDCRGKESMARRSQ